MRVRASPLVACLLTACLLTAVAPPAARASASQRAPAPVTYLPPVDAPVLEEFRPPAEPYGRGNRGIDYATAAGTPARAAAPGEVTFAGQVGARLHVVVLHDDGVRTSYSFLSSVSVRRGQRVSAGTPLGVTAGALHFGARAGDAYLDPAVLLGGAETVHLVPVARAGAASEAQERSWLARALRGVAMASGEVVAAGAGAVGWAREAGGEVATLLRAGVAAEIDAWLTRARVAGHYVRAFDPATIGVGMGRAFLRWRHAECTAPADPAPVPGRGRILVLVAGFGSAGGDAGVLDVDWRGLGYLDADVAQFSYRGGRVPGVGDLGGVGSTGYASRDSQGDLRVAGDRLRDLLRQIRAAHPGRAVDLVAHSQGGLVVRAALGGTAPLDPSLPAIGAVVTLGAPHQGADAATAAALVAASDSGGLLLAGGARLSGLGASSPAARQLAETSRFVEELRALPLPASIRVTSIAARGDPVVASPRSLLAGATNVLLAVDGPDAHRRVVTSREARRAVALAIAGMPPPCAEWGEVVTGVVRGTAMGLAEDGLGAVLGGAATWVDLRSPGPSRPPVRSPAGGGRR